MRSVRLYAAESVLDGPAASHMIIAASVAGGLQSGANALPDVEIPIYRGGHKDGAGGACAISYHEVGTAYREALVADMCMFHGTWCG